MRRKKRRVEQLLNENWWDGFWSRMNGSRIPHRALEYREGPRWWNDVADVAYAAGFQRASDMIARVVESDNRRFSIGLSNAPRPSASTVADCYAAAGLIAPRTQDGER